MISYRTVAAKIKAEAPGLASQPDAAVTLFAAQKYPDQFPKDQIDWTDHSAVDHPTVDPTAARQQSADAAQQVGRTGLLGMIGGGGDQTASAGLGVKEEDFYNWANQGQSNPNMMNNQQAASAIKDAGILPAAREAVQGMGNE